MSGTSPERSRNLLYVGGHMRVEDSFGTSPEDIMSQIRATLERELAEEVGTTLSINATPFAFWDRDGSEKSQRHLAIIHTSEVQFETLRLRLDGYELVQPHSSSLSGKVVSVNEALSWPQRSTESWSRAILSYIFGRRNPALFELDNDLREENRSLE